MAQKTFDLLKAHEGQLACINGATQIRAGVIRPEVVIPLADDASHAEKSERQIRGLEIGTPVRVIRAPFFGKLGTVTQLPSEPHVLDSGSKARVLEVEIDQSHERVIVPRANVELIED